MSAVSHAVGPSDLQQQPAAGKRGRGNVALRFASGFVAVPLLIGFSYLGDPFYSLFILAACAYAAFELRGMLRSGGYVAHDLALFSTAVLLPLDAWLRPDGGWLGSEALALLTIIVVISLVTLLFTSHIEGALVNWALSLALALYIGALMQFYMPLRHFPSAEFPGFWVIALLVLSWVCDSSAFFVGRAYGKTQLAPVISPKKSVEGAVAGLIFPALVAPLLGLLIGAPTLLMAGYGLAIAVATILGDLVESLIKRQTGVKDSGVLIPGHGGLLDRMDSLLFCAPVAVFYLHAFLA
jgi:phosphatidate cytidylyltransferase